MNVGNNNMNTPRPSLSHRALVLFSGGQDSTTCLAWALSRYDKVETIGFDYGQRHAIELKVRPTLLEKMRGFSPEWQKKTRRRPHDRSLADQRYFRYSVDARRRHL